MRGEGENEAKMERSRRKREKEAEMPPSFYSFPADACLPHVLSLLPFHLSCLRPLSLPSLLAVLPQPGLPRENEANGRLKSFPEKTDRESKAQGAREADARVKN